MKEHIDKSAFYYFGLLPEVCIHSPLQDQYSKSYIPRVKCDCGCTEWIEQGCTMAMGYYPDKTPMCRNVHRCKECHGVRMADHIGAQSDGDV